MLTIATRLAIDTKRRKAPLLAAEDAREEEVHGRTTPETELARRELGRAIAAAGEELSPDHRAVFVLAEFHDLTLAEIADAVGIPENTAKTRLFRARQHMRERLLKVRREVDDGDK
jgi:RNA polymerase sigma-70 factor (ECF subfamily)